MTMQHYKGSCQCGAVTFEADLDLDRTVTCNCSRCQRLGSVLTFTPRDKFQLKSGEDNLTEYRFNKRRIQHLFCKTCGIEGFGYGSMPDGTPMTAVNVNCLEGVEPRELALKSKHHDGRSA
jgi:hypothetical protein